MRKFKKFKNKPAGSNAVDGATTTHRNFGFRTIPGKGGKTNNASIPEAAFKRELKDMKEEAACA